MTSLSPKALFVVLVVVMGSVSALLYLPSVQSSVINPLPQAGETNSNLGIPDGVWNNAPYPGWQYFVTYSSDNGDLLSIVAMRDQQISEYIAQCSSPLVGSDLSNVFRCMLGNQVGVSELNATGYSNLEVIQKHMNAYYVDLQTTRVTLRSGWNNCTNPNYGNGTTPCK